MSVYCIIKNLPVVARKVFFVLHDLLKQRNDNSAYNIFHFGIIDVVVVVKYVFVRKRVYYVHCKVRFFR